MNTATTAKTRRRLAMALGLIICLAVSALATTGALLAAQPSQSNRPAPTGLTVTPGTNAGELNVSWDAHAGETKDYRVSWAPENGNFRTWTNTGWNAYPTDATLTITGLQGGARYKVRVRARFDNGPSSPWSPIKTAAATATPPAADDAEDEDEQERDTRSNHVETPQNLSAQEISWAQATLSWDAPTDSDVTHVRVQRSGGTISEHESVLVGTTTTITQNELAPSNTYTYRVSFGTSETDFGPEAEIQVTTLDIPAPTNLRATTLEHNDVVIAWDNPTNTAGLRVSVERQVTDQNSIPLYVKHYDGIRASHTEQEEVEVVAGEQYTYKVWYRVLDEEGRYHSGDTVNAIDFRLFNVPNPPQLSIADAQATEGQAVTFTITVDRTYSGTISVDYATSIGSNDNAESGDFYPTSGTAMILPNETSTTFSVQTREILPRYEGDETFTVTLSNPVGAEIAQATAKGTIIEDEPLPTVSFAHTATTINNESGRIHNQAVVINITPTSENVFHVTLNFSGTAQAGEDYVALPSQVLIAVAQSVKQVPLQIIDGAVYEDNEEIIIRLVADNQTAQADPDADTLTITIQDDDPPPVLTVTTHPGTEGGQNDGTEPVEGQDFGNVVFCFTLQGAFVPRITAKLETADGHAVRGQDYEFTPANLTFLPDNSTNCVKAKVIDDTEFEGGRTETFTLRVYDANHPVIPGGELHIKGTILDNDQPPEGVDYVPDDTTTASEIAVGESWINLNPFKGRIEHKYDEDWYRTELTKGHCYQIEIRGKSDAELGHPVADDLTLYDPYLNGVHRADGVYLPGTWNDDGGVDNSARHTIRFNKTGTYYLAVTHGSYDNGGTFDVSLINLGKHTKTCTEVDVDNLTYEPGLHDGM